MNRCTGPVRRRLARHAQSLSPTVAPVVQPIAGEHHDTLANGAARAWLAHTEEIDTRALAKIVLMSNNNVIKVGVAILSHFGPRLLAVSIDRPTGSRSWGTFIIATVTDGQLCLMSYGVGNKRPRDVTFIDIHISMHALSRCFQRATGSTDFEAAMVPLARSVLDFVNQVDVGDNGEHHVSGAVFKMETGEDGPKATMVTWLGNEQ